MPRLNLKPFGHILFINSKGRKFNEYWTEIKTKGTSLYIDGRNVGRTKCGDRYIFHLIDGKIDHYFVVRPEDFMDWDWNDSAPAPYEWCDECIDGDPGENWPLGYKT